MKVSWDDIPILWKNNNHVPNPQPVMKLGCCKTQIVGITLEDVIINIGILIKRNEGNHKWVLTKKLRPRPQIGMSIFSINVC